MTAQRSRHSLQRCLPSVLLGLLLLCAGQAGAAPPKRAVPDYSGRGEAPDSALDVWLVLPRIVLSPLYVVSEFVVRRPLGFLIAEAERAKVPEALYDLFAFGPDHQAGLLPTAFVDFGFEPSVGFYFFYNDAVVPKHDLRVSGSIWDTAWLAGNVTSRVRLRSNAWIGAHFTGKRRPDLMYFGLGARSLPEARARFGASNLDAGIEGSLAGPQLLRLDAGLGVRSLNFHRADDDHGTLLETRVAEGRYPLPPGFETGYTVLYNRLLVALDSRGSRLGQLSGMRAELSAEQMSDVRRASGAGYLRYAGSLGGFYELDAHGRVLSLSFSAQFADPLGERAVPFSELVAFGGSGPMRGFLPNRLLGRSGTVATLRYRWPIWIWFDGSIQFAIGNVFDAHLRDFDPKLLRLSAAIGLESGAPDSSFELLFGLGTETFEHGTQITSLRLLVGSNHGF